MATQRRAAQPAAPAMRRPTPTGGRQQLPDPYGSQPNPRGPPYPWSVGGSSREVGVPDNWQQFYPTEGHGRGDAWAANKAQLGRERELARPGQPDLFMSQHDRQMAQQNPQFARMHPEALSGNAADRITRPQFGPPPTKGAPGGGGLGKHTYPLNPDGSIAYPQSMIDQDRQATGNPQQYDWQVGGWPQGHSTTATALKMHGVRPGPLNNIGGAPGSGGTYNPNGTITPPAGQPAGTARTAAATQQGPATPGANQKQSTAAQQAFLGPQFAKMKPGSTVKIGGQTYTKNAEGAVVNMTDPKNRKRLTNRQGQFFDAPTGTPQQTQQTQTPVTQQQAPAPQQPDYQAQIQQLQDQLQQFQQGFGQTQQNDIYQRFPDNSYMQRPSFYGGASMMDPYGGGMNSMGGGFGARFGGGYGMEQMGAYGLPAGGISVGPGGSEPMMSGAYGAQPQWSVPAGGGMGMTDVMPNYNPGYIPETAQMNPYNPNMSMFY